MTGYLVMFTRCWWQPSNLGVGKAVDKTVSCPGRERKCIWLWQEPSLWSTFSLSCGNGWLLVSMACPAHAASCGFAL